MFPLTRDRSRNRSAFGYRPTLNLIFGPNSGDTLDPRITFSRTSNATQFDSAGNLVYAPHNLLTFSEQFDNAAWSKNAITVTANSVAAPNSTTTADVLIADATNAEHFSDQAFTAVAGNTYTVSAHFRANGLTDVGLRFTVGGLWNGGASPQVRFNLVDGTITSPIGGSPSASSIQNLGNGWFRCSMSAICVAGGTPSVRVQLMSGTNNTFAGNGVNGIATWGAQLNVGALQPYYPTTVKNALGFTQEFDNAAWAKSNSTITANATAAPDGSVTADKLVEDTATAVHSVGQFNPVAGSTYTISVYAKAAERSRIQFSGGGFGALGFAAVFDLSNGTMAVNTGSKGSISSVGNGWYRCSVTFMASNTVTFAWSPTDNSNNGNYTGNGTSGVFLWGAQVSDSASLDPYVYNPVAAPTAAAYYGPRFDYDPATLAARGLLIEEQRTQLLLWSEDFTQASWSKSNATATGNTAVAPSGLTTADTLAATANNGTVTQGVTTTAAAFTFSVYLKRKTGTGNVDISMDGTTWVTQTINSTTWTRCIVTQTGVAGTSNPGIRLAVSGDEVFAWGAQAE